MKFATSHSRPPLAEEVLLQEYLRSLFVLPRCVSALRIAYFGVSRNLRPLTKLLALAKQLAGVNPGRTCNLGGNGAGLHGRYKNPFRLRLRPAPATLHRRDHLDLRLGQ